MQKSKNLVSLDEFIDKEIGPKGTKKRLKFDAGYEAFKLGIIQQQATQRIITDGLGGQLELSIKF